MKKKTGICLILLVFFVFPACTAKVYMNDRHTIMEDEAAGEWPELDKNILNRTEETGPTALQNVPNNSKKKRLYNVLNGEPVTAGTASK